MPKGDAPFPKKGNVDKGLADKAKAVAGGYDRTSKTEGYNRKITYGKKGRATMTSAMGPSDAKFFKHSTKGK